MKKIGTSILLFLFCYVAPAQEFSDVDENADGFTELEEFTTFYSEDFVEGDSNTDGSLDDEEFLDNSFAWNDEDNDGYLDEGEWNAAYDETYSNYAHLEEFYNYDENRDEKISSGEYRKGVANSGLFDRYDTNNDKKIDRSELSEGLFKWWDQNKDDVLDSEEFDRNSSRLSQ